VSTPTPTRWLDPAWQARVLAWADAELARLGRTRTGWSHPHVRAWSTVLRLETDAGPVWLKAPGDGARWEVPLLQLMAALDVPCTPRPLAADVDEAWILLPDGGEVSRVAHGGKTPPEVMASYLPRYAEVQQRMSAHVPELLAMGLADMRPEGMAARFETWVEELRGLRRPGHLEADQAARLLAVLPAYAEACAELAASGIAPTLQHDDLHDSNILAAGPVFIDWGDACVGHPFGTMLATLNSMAWHHGLAPDAPELLHAVDAYTEAWTDVHDRATLRHLVQLAQRVGPLTRSLSYAQATTNVDEDAWQEHASAMPEWLLEVFEPDLPTRPPLLG